MGRRDDLWLKTVRLLLSPGPNGKRLLIGPHPKLRAALQNTQPDLTKVDQLPALAYACHTIVSTTLWLQFTKPERTHPTIGADGFARMEFSGAVDWGYMAYGELADADEDAEDDGNLIATVRT